MHWPRQFLLSLALVAMSMETKANEAEIQRIDLRLCDQKQSHCLSISALSGRNSHLQNTLSLEVPKVSGLNLDGRAFSSAIIDFNSGVILLREQKNGTYIGEWLIGLDSLSSHFYAVPR